MAQQGDVMARVIEFYVPINFQPDPDRADPETSGKLLEFPSDAAQEPWRALVAELSFWEDLR